MIIQSLLFLILLILLFFLSGKISTSIYTSIFAVTKSRKLAIGLLVILLLPGTIIHEMSHFLVATILRVPTGELTVIPTIEKNGEVKAGKLTLGVTDPFRLSLIGLAPMIVGLFLIYFVGKAIPFTPGESIQPPQGWSATFLLFAICYLLFTISTTMFSSKKDLAGLKITVPIILLVLISLYTVGVRVFFDKSLISKIELVVSALNYYLLITAVINFLVLLVLSANLYLWQKILKRRVN